MKTSHKSQSLFLGLDSSTQGLKATIVDKNSRVVFETGVNFDSDLPEFKTRGGAHQHEDGLTVTSPPIMWVAALDLLLARLRDNSVRLDAIAAISGSGQQHGSVYLRPGTADKLASLDSRLSLCEQLGGIFTIEESPIWMDSSTTKQCRERDAAIGGAQAMAELTGSRSYERFTGNQVARIAQERPDAYRDTERIALVSSFMASLMIGGYAPIEPGDGAGMNLMDIRSKRWDARALACTAPDLEAKLGEITPSHSVIGMVSRYHVERHRFSKDCVVIAFSGDNPNSLAALRLEKSGEIAVSLGTSDTLFGALSEPRPSATEGHIFGNPINPDGYMALMCIKNGSLTREAVRDESAGGSWTEFENALKRTSPGNGGRIGFYFREPEITPPVLSPGIHRFGPGDETSVFTGDENIRAVVEGQFLSMRLHGANIGLTPRTVLATGGASVNRSLLQVMADVFGTPVHTCSQANSASLGAALRALHGWRCRQAGQFVSFSESIRLAEPFVQAASPDKKAHEVYTKMLPRYAELERGVTE